MLDHHAFLCRLPVVTAGEVAKAAEQLPSASHVYISGEAFGIDDVRSLTEHSYLRPGEGSDQLLIVSPHTITVEAQQALLKLLEEPPLGTSFLFCVPESLYLLPTVVSRFRELSLSPLTLSHNDVFSLFLSQSVGERLLEITSRTQKKDHDWIQKIKTGLSSHLMSHRARYGSADLQALLSGAQQLLTRGAANKYLLEEVAFSLDRAAEKP